MNISLSPCLAVESTHTYDLNSQRAWKEGKVEIPRFYVARGYSEEV